MVASISPFSQPGHSAAKWSIRRSAHAQRGRCRSRAADRITPAAGPSRPSRGCQCQPELSSMRSTLFTEKRKSAVPVSKKLGHSYGGPRVRISLPPAASLSLAGLYLPGQEPWLSARVSGLRSRHGRQRDAGTPIARQPGAVSLSGHIPVPRFRRCGRDKSLS
jgi:hypothetical protein